MEYYTGIHSLSSALFFVGVFQLTFSNNGVGARSVARHHPSAGPEKLNRQDERNGPALFSGWNRPAGLHRLRPVRRIRAC